MILFKNNNNIFVRLFFKVRSAIVCLKPKSVFILIDVKKIPNNYLYSIYSSRVFTDNAIEAFESVTNEFLKSAIDNENANSALKEAKEIINA